MTEGGFVCGPAGCEPIEPWGEDRFVEAALIVACGQADPCLTCEPCRETLRFQRANVDALRRTYPYAPQTDHESGLIAWEARARLRGVTTR